MTIPGSVGVFSVATNIYLDYWLDMAISAASFLRAEAGVTLHVFTDRPSEAAGMAPRVPGVTVVPIGIPPLGWPEATMDRYRLVHEHADQIAGDTLVHVDADMLFVAPVGTELDPDAWLGGMAFVRHPGYFRPAGRQRLALYARSPRTALSDVSLRRKSGGIGTWEDRVQSTAYVQRPARGHYYCGGVWMGRREPLLTMSSELARQVADDHRRGIIAVWHDESHLNSYACRHPHTELGPEYCFVPEYPQLGHIAPRIIAVDKGLRRTR